MMVFGVPYSPHEGPPRDVTLRCHVTICLAADDCEDEVESASSADPLSLLDWRGVLTAAYDVEDVCRVESANLERVVWEHESRVELSIVLDITLFREDESLESLSLRFSDDWHSHNDSFDVPDPWEVSVSGSCEPLSPALADSVRITEWVTAEIGHLPLEAPIVLVAGEFPHSDDEEIVSPEAMEVSRWLTSFNGGHHVATLESDGRIYGVYQGHSSRYFAAFSLSDVDRKRSIATGLTGVFHLLTVGHRHSNLAVLPAVTPSAIWPWSEQTNAFAAAWAFSWDGAVRAEKRVATIRLVIPPSSSGLGSELDARSLWHLSMTRQYWSGVPLGVPELCSVAPESVGAPAVPSLRIWRVEHGDGSGS